MKLAKSSKRRVSLALNWSVITQSKPFVAASLAVCGSGVPCGIGVDMG